MLRLLIIYCAEYRSLEGNFIGKNTKKFTNAVDSLKSFENVGCNLIF